VTKKCTQVQVWAPDLYELLVANVSQNEDTSVIETIYTRCCTNVHFLAHNTEPGAGSDGMRDSTLGSTYSELCVCLPSLPAPGSVSRLLSYSGNLEGYNQSTRNAIREFEAMRRAIESFQTSACVS
jgi:hypothetical protein